jgi:hypothetical protein
MNDDFIPDDLYCGYIEDLETVVASCMATNSVSHSFLENLWLNDPKLLARLLWARKAFMTDSDKSKGSPYLDTGYFREFSADDRLILFVLSLEIEHGVHKKEMGSRLQPYSKEHALFKAAPDLWSHVRVSGERPADLVNSQELQFVPGTEFVRFCHLFAELDYGLNPRLVEWFRQKFPKNPLYVRLHPSRVFSSQPPSRLNEAIIKPIDPEWWTRMEVYPGQLTGLALELVVPLSPQDDPEAWWEHKIKGIRRWEMSVKRSKSDYISAMLEELVHRDAFQEVIGYCIHLDSNATVGTTADKASLMHLDLAINWYPGERGMQRLTQRLDQGKVETATRTHLLRVENIPFTALFEIASNFLVSRVLLREWLSAQNAPALPSN